MQLQTYRIHLGIVVCVSQLIELLFTNVLALLLIHAGFDVNENRVDILVIRESHATIRVHGGRRVELEIIKLGQEPLAEKRCSLGKGLDFWASNLCIILQLLANVLAVHGQVILKILLAQWNFMQIESNALINHVVHILVIIVNFSFTTAEFTTATNIY